MADNKFYDLPFIYVADADGLTDGRSYFGNALPLDAGSEFRLRRIAGRNLVCAQSLYRDAKGFNRSNAVFAAPPDYVVAPEMVYPPGGQIGYDLINVNRANWPYAVGGSVPNYYSQIALQGVKRYWEVGHPYKTPYRYFNKPYTISQQFTLAVAGRMAPAYVTRTSPIRVTARVDDYDFELQYIIISLILTGAQRVTPVLANANLKLTLYAPGEVALSNAPVVDFFLNGNQALYNSTFPTPYVLYPASGQIIMDVVSLLLDTQVPATVWVDFVGAWRFPC